jgi:hypothetical protein
MWNVRFTCLAYKRADKKNYACYKFLDDIFVSNVPDLINKKDYLLYVMR